MMEIAGVVMEAIAVVVMEAIAVLMMGVARRWW
jgi:hypothetical protein